MAENELLRRLGRALQPGPVEPPPERVRAMRQMVERGAARGDGRVHEAELGPLALVGGSVASRSARPGEQEAYGPDAGGPTGDELARARDRRQARPRLPRVLSGMVAAAAVALLVAMVGVRELPATLREVAHGVGLPVDSPDLAEARSSLERLELALARRDSGEVAEADAAVLRSTGKLKGSDLREVRDRAVRLHVAALAFLRDHPSPSALSDLPRSPSRSPGTALPPGAAGPGSEASPSPGTPSGPRPPAGGSGGTPAVPTTVAPQPRTVTITSISPRLDATFQVDFQVSGFTLGPGQPYSVHFFYDSGQEVSNYSGPSPWTFPLLNAIRYRTLCARVADAAGVEDPASGNCHDILLL